MCIYTSFACSNVLSFHYIKQFSETICYDEEDVFNADLT